MGCGTSKPPVWEPEHVSRYTPLTMKTVWKTDRHESSARIELTVNDNDGTSLLKLEGGYVYMDGSKCQPSDAVITEPSTGATWRAICKVSPKHHDKWSWVLQESRAINGTAADLECSVCMSPFYQPVKFPAPPDTGCDHVFCRECVVRCLASGQSLCPLCRSPLAEGMTALKAKRLPTDGATEAEFATAFACAPYSINFVSGNPLTTWNAPADGDGDHSTLPKAISVKPTDRDSKIRAWCGSPPKKMGSISERERDLLLGFATMTTTSEKRPAKSICIREVALGVEPNMMRTASKADLAVFLAILTETFWSRGGHGNMHIARNPWGGPLYREK